MSRLSDRLAEHYERHYARVNVTTDPVAAARGYWNNMEAMYGDLVSSLPEGSRVLDLGCGTGTTLYWLSRRPGIIPAGVDSSSSQVNVAKRSMPGIDISCEDGLAFLNTRHGTFAGILCMDVLEHLETEDLCLEWVEAARRALTPGGFFFCRVPNAANLFGCYSRYMDLTHRRLFTSASLLQLFEAGGFRDCRVTPERPGSLRSRFRQGVEAPFHRFLFRLCGRGALENVFSSNVCIAAFK